MIMDPLSEAEISKYKKKALEFDSISKFMRMLMQAHNTDRYGVVDLIEDIFGDKMVHDIRHIVWNWDDDMAMNGKLTDEEVDSMLKYYWNNFISSNMTQAPED